MFITRSLKIVKLCLYSSLKFRDLAVVYARLSCKIKFLPQKRCIVFQTKAQNYQRFLSRNRFEIIPVRCFFLSFIGSEMISKRAQIARLSTPSPKIAQLRRQLWLDSGPCPRENARRCFHGGQLLLGTTFLCLIKTCTRFSRWLLLKIYLWGNSSVEFLIV
jgi:hypothetical protein